VSAADDKVTVSLHKMVRDQGTTGGITSDGTNQGTINGFSDWNKSSHGDVEFSIYSVDSAFTAWKAKPGTPSYDNDGDAFNAFQKYILDFGDDHTALLADLGITEADQTIDSRKDENNANLFNFTQITNSGKYMILETYADASHTTTKAAPIVFNLPLEKATGDTVHLYAKNDVPKTDPELEKKMENPNEPGEFIFKSGIKFTLTKDTGDFTPVESSTNAQGRIKIENLAAGDYTLTETAVDGYTPITIKFNVSGGNITITDSPDDVHAKKEGSVWTIYAKNFLKFGEKDFTKIDSKDSEKLAGAVFYVKNNSVLGQGEFAQFEGGKFVKWVANKENATPFTSGDGDNGTTLGAFNIPLMPYGTYYLEEDVAPNHYGKLDSTIPFTIDGDSEAEAAKEIKNTKYDLPITGGMGIWVFVLVGAVLMGGAGFYYYKSRKNKLI
ncbi:SpaA isopeptide-forming pilin-related protein, partial [Pediococcus damnosus]